MTDTYTIQPICKEHLSRYGEIYASAFCGKYGFKKEDEVILMGKELRQA